MPLGGTDAGGISAANGGMILIVEDDDRISRVERFVLEQVGYRVTWAGTGEDALEILDHGVPYQGELLERPIGRLRCWSDLLVDFGGGSFSEDRYIWPTALISVKDVYTVTATDDADNNQVIALQVWVGDENGVIDTWNLQ